jgi:hypothetical protein
MEEKGRIGLGDVKKEKIPEPEVETEVETEVENDAAASSEQSNKKEPVKNPVKSKVKKEEKTEDYILFPDLEIDGYIIRPWTLGKLRKINPHLENIFKSLEEKQVILSIDNIGSHLKEIYFAAVPEIVSILAISLDVQEDDLEDVTIPQAIKLIYSVFKQNEDSIKNVSSLLQLASMEQTLP